MVYMVGTITKDHANVEKLEYTKHYAHQTPRIVAWRAVDYHRVKARTEAQGKVIVGMLHSHPNDWSGLVSQADFDLCSGQDLSVCGIVSITGRSTSVSFWTMNSPVPCIIAH
jgi:proteasome lid subunit RPN8/RPN11